MAAKWRQRSPSTPNNPHPSPSKPAKTQQLIDSQRLAMVSKSAVARRVGSSPTPAPSEFNDLRPSSRMAFCFSGRCEEVYPQTHRPTDPQTHRPTDPQTHRPTDPQTLRPSDLQPHRLSGHQPLGLPSPQSMFCAMRHSTPEGSYRQNTFMRHGWVTSSVTLTP